MDACSCKKPRVNVPAKVLRDTYGTFDLTPDFLSTIHCQSYVRAKARDSPSSDKACTEQLEMSSKAAVIFSKGDALC